MQARRPVPVDSMQLISSLGAYEAYHRQHDAVTPAHAVLGVLRNRQTSASVAIDALGLDRRAILAAIDVLFPARPDVILLGRPANTQSCMRLWESFFTIPRDLSEHRALCATAILLLLVLREKSESESILKSAGLNEDALLEQIRHMRPDFDEPIPVPESWVLVQEFARSLRQKHGTEGPVTSYDLLNAALRSYGAAYTIAKKQLFQQRDGGAAIERFLHDFQNIPASVRGTPPVSLIRDTVARHSDFTGVTDCTTAYVLWACAASSPSPLASTLHKCGLTEEFVRQEIESLSHSG